MSLADILPEDIWRTIASHLSAQKRRQMISLNRVFFNVALEERYYEVQWITLDWRTLETLVRLQEPMVARKVRRLHIRAWFIEHLLKRDALLSPGTIVKYKVATWTSFLCNFLNPPAKHISPNLLGDALSTQNAGRYYRSLKNTLEAQNPSIPSSHVIIRSMVNAITGMAGVTEYHFEWRDLPLNNDTRMFLTLSVTVFRINLHSLVLSAQISKFEHLLKNTSFPYLEELNLHFDYAPCIASQDGHESINKEEDILLHAVIPFINSHKTYLHSLKISSAASADLSSFFLALGTFPSLRRYAVQLNFDQAHLSVPTSLTQTLTAHASTLLHVQLKPYGFDVTSPPLPLQRTMSELWKPVLNNPRSLTNLESLTMPSCNQRDMLILLRRNSNTLSHLCLLGRFLGYQDVVDVVDVFSHRPYALKHLHVEIDVLGKQVIGLLARRLPGLKTLILVFNRLMDVDSSDLVCSSAPELLKKYVHFWLPYIVRSSVRYERRLQVCIL
ncbi:hypothetical protein BDQ12DRAFT_605859 [Crucibulum laeve]|uniref:F-box domain-containing protein n=1 Tax=Crucibulum laeve TaxID=68775 RepID=A0A5C3M081_9AGAR|nr:hypothetical protein BDQ12DRAFT_605859 [Crucibulum laeve]